MGSDLEMWFVKASLRLCVSVNAKTKRMLKVNGTQMALESTVLE
jgi:hypothetical protein